VLDNEILVHQSWTPSFLVPVPPVALVEDDIARDPHTLRCRVEDAISLSPVHVPDEDAGMAAVVELLKLSEILGEGEATECA
jgi:hypothetical protein